MEELNSCQICPHNCRINRNNGDVMKNHVLVEKMALEQYFSVIAI